MKTEQISFTVVLCGNPDSFPYALEFATFPGFEKRILRPLPNQQLSALACNWLGVSKLSLTLERFLIDRSKGLPAICQELLNSLHTKGLLVCDEKFCDLSPQYLFLSGSLSPADGLQNLMLARLNHLPPRELHILKCASIVGLYVELPLLEVALPDIWRNSVHIVYSLRTLARCELVEISSCDPVGSFQARN